MRPLIFLSHIWAVFGLRFGLLAEFNAEASLRERKRLGKRRFYVPTPRRDVRWLGKPHDLALGNHDLALGNHDLALGNHDLAGIVSFHVGFKAKQAAQVRRLMHKNGR